MKFALKVYKHKKVEKFQIQALIQYFIDNDLDLIFDHVVTQVNDPVACYSVLGNLSDRTARSIFEKTNGGEIVLIPLAHGATPAGLDIYIRYCELTKNKNSYIYPCRFSRHKLKDTQPKLNREELEFLQLKAADKTVVILEENVVTGVTLDEVADYFSKHVFVGRPILKETNLNIAKKLKTEHLSAEHHDRLIEEYIYSLHKSNHQTK